MTASSAIQALKDSRLQSTCSELIAAARIAADTYLSVSGPSQAVSATRAGPRQKVMNTPLPGGGVMQTPMLAGWQKAQFGGAFATVVKKAGRGAKTNAGNAIVVTCAGEVHQILIIHYWLRPGLPIHHVMLLPV